MSLVFAGVTPHSPILLPNVGKGKEKELDCTIESLQTLEEHLYVSNPDVIFVISPHGGLYEDAFTINAHDTFISDFSTFGDLDTKDEWKGATDFASKISHKAKHQGLSVRLSSTETLEHGDAVPLHFLAKKFESVKILPIGFSNLPTEDHIAFGEIIKEVVMESTKRIAIIISGDLSHTLTEDSPGGYHADGEKFDTAIMDALEVHRADEIINLTPSIVENADQCGYRSLLVAMGILKNMDVQFKKYCYEHPFGVGYLTGEFIL
jgi:MEMO1 family protein